MNEAQEKPKQKWYKKWQFIVIVIVAMGFLFVFSAFYIFYTLVSEDGCCPPSYNGFKDDIQNAVGWYMTENNGALPTLSGIYTNANCSNCNVINISAFLRANGGLVQEVPDGTWQGPGASDDNCDAAGKSISGCSASNHYIWIVDTHGDPHGIWGDPYGNVYSYCIGDNCTSNNSGYQGVWP